MFEEMLNECMEVFSMTAIYRLEGLDLEIPIIMSGEDRINDFNGSSIRSTDALIFDVLATDLQTPQRGATVILSGREYLIKSFNKEDPERRIWTIDCAPA